MCKVVTWEKTVFIWIFHFSLPFFCSIFCILSSKSLKVTQFGNTPERYLALCPPLIKIRKENNKNISKRIVKKAQHSITLMIKLSHPRAGRKRRVWPTPAPPHKVDAHTSRGWAIGT